jgi:hypothetical protein
MKLCRSELAPDYQWSPRICGTLEEHREQAHSYNGLPSAAYTQPLTCIAL